MQKKRKVVQANNSFRKSLEIAPNNGITHYYYGRFLYENQRYAQASRHLKKASVWKSADPWMHYELGRALHRVGDTVGAMESYEKAWSTGQLPAAANALGAVHFLEGSLVQAQKYFEYTLTQESDNIEALVNLSLLDIRKGHTEKGLHSLTELEKRFPDSRTIRQAIKSTLSRSHAP